MQKSHFLSWSNGAHKSHSTMCFEKMYVCVRWLLKRKAINLRKSILRWIRKSNILNFMLSLSLYNFLCTACFFTFSGVHLKIWSKCGYLNFLKLLCGKIFVSHHAAADEPREYTFMLDASCFILLFRLWNVSMK